VAPKYSDDKSQLLVLNQKCIRSGRVSLGPARRTLTDKVPAAKLITYGDILVNSTGVGTLGRVAIWHHKKIATVDSHVTIVRFDEEKVDPIIAGFAMFDAQPKIEQLGEGSTGQTELSRLKLNRLKIRIPSQNQDSDLAAKIRTLEAQSDALLLQSKTIAELRDTLLPKLMSGELRVKDAERLVEDAV
jgi:type I restriction enzyme S subunit